MRGRLDIARLLAAAEELAQFGAWGFDLHTLESVWSEGMCRLHGTRPANGRAGIETLLRVSHEDDRERIRSVIELAIAEPERIPERGLAVEYRVGRDDGAIRRLRMRFRVEHDSRGAPATLVGAVQDVTDRRLADAELQAHYALG